MKNQDQGVLSHRVSGLVPVGPLECGHGRLGSVTESVEPAGRGPIEDEREGRLGPLGNLGGGVDPALVAATVAEADGPERF